jgi:flagellar assembly factor FliW
MGKQAVLSDSRWKTKHDIMAELASPSEALSPAEAAVTV